MAVYLCSAAGDGTVGSASSGNPTSGEWDTAFNLLATAVAAATSPGDIILVDHAAPDAATATKTLAFAADRVSLICVDKTTNIPTPCGDAAWTGATASNAGTVFSAPGRRVYIYGLTCRNGASGSTGSMTFSGDGASFVAEDCYLWLGSSSSSSMVMIGQFDHQVDVEFRNLTYRRDAGSRDFWLHGRVRFIGGRVIGSNASQGHPLFKASTTDATTGVHEWIGMDFSACGVAPLIADSTRYPTTAKFIQCKLGTGYVPLAPQTTHPNRSSAEVELIDCSVGDTHGIHEYHNALGNLTTDAGIYFTAGAAGVSWKITTTANVSVTHPFTTPWLAWFHAGTSSITPRFEILRDGSSTAYTDAQVWFEGSAKVTSGTVLPTLYSDRQSLTDFAVGTAGAAQATGAGTGAWTGPSGTAWSGKIDSGSAFTPAEVGDILGRICFAAPSATVYVNPEPLT